MNEKQYIISEKGIEKIIDYSAMVSYRDFHSIRIMAAILSINVLFLCAVSLWLGSVKNFIALYMAVVLGILFFVVYMCSGIKRNLNFFKEEEIKKFNNLLYKIQIEGEIDSIIEDIDDMFGTPK